MTEPVIRHEHFRVRYFPEKLETNLALQMILVLGGSFQMGSPTNEPERLSCEGPQHEVRVPSFFIGRYPVTQAQWKFVAELSLVRVELAPEPSNFKGGDRPVESITWYEAVEFCDRLSAYTGRPYRLPSEAEWEYACRAGTATPFHFGETITTDLANYNGNFSYGDGPKGTYREETTPVGKFPANAYGLQDMCGNVREWCADHWHDSYESHEVVPTNGSARIIGGYNNASRVICGGSWYDNPRWCRSASRVDYSPSKNSYRLGFRVVCSPPRL